MREVRSDASAATEKYARELYKELESTTINDILKFGLHAYLIQYLEHINELGLRLSNDVLLPAAPAETV